VSSSKEIEDVSDLSRKLLQAQEEERRRITRELHDDTGQALMVLRFQLEMVLGEAENNEQKTKIQESLALLDRTIEALRRIIARLSPRVLEELGLITGIQKLAQLLTRHTGMKSRLSLPAESASLDHDLQVAIYRAVQEALHNVAKHSRASTFTVRLAVSRDKAVLEIEDDGVGFTPRTAADRGFGLKGMQERATAFGGSLKVRSHPGKGARVRLVFNLEEQGNHTPAGKSLRRASAA